ncbi:hypothetical protein [Gordonia insulae]|uniref:Tetratricopeptide repeat protein n=1 Tax=Gordonia insulae TaxID=2420509 RepID=A0A3G8JEM2_9ACTN|nr:hypothetical protein [Gordonia insulae]AZG43631.1 hypothetical protein D7316_00200 [Gordonia insulae]
MTEAPSDPVLARITAAVGRSHGGDLAGARQTLIALWTEIRPDGDAFHRCVLAHYLADMFADPAEALMWDTRALDAADALSDGPVTAHGHDLQVAAFYPSLHLNLADNLRRLGSFEAAGTHLAAARDRLDLLGDDAYGDIIRQGIAGVAEGIAHRSTAPSPTAPAQAQ